MPQDYQTETFSSVQFSCSVVSDFATPWTTAHQASLSITNSRSPPKPMSTESVMPSNHLILCRPLLLLPSIFPNIRAFSKSQLFASGGQNIGVSASTSVLPMNIQDWFPLGWTPLIYTLMLEEIQILKLLELLFKNCFLKIWEMQSFIYLLGKLQIM